MTDVSIAPYDATTLTPVFDQWPIQLDANRCRAPFAWRRLRIEHQKTLRHRIIEGATAFVEELETMARDRGVPDRSQLESHQSTKGTSPSRNSPDEESARRDLATSHPTSHPTIVMTGHQPIVFHPGLIYKYEMTERFARSQGASAVSILMDTDSGDAGRFQVPVSSPPGANVEQWPVSAIRTESFATSGELFRGQRLLSQPELKALNDRTLDELDGCECFQARRNFLAIASTYEKLAGCPAVLSNSIVRRVHGIANGLLELPLSTLCRFPEVQQFIYDLAFDGVALHRDYNRTLDAWRRERKLRNPAQPFPNLASRNQEYELPLWRVNLRSNTRQSVWVRSTDDGVQLRSDHDTFARLRDGECERSGLLGDDEVLVPRGALITTIFRLLCSDLFVHGLGGRTYDKYTDRLIQSYFGVEPPSFVVASASTFLFDASRTRLDQLDELASRQRELAHHSERFVGQGWFSESAERRLSPLIEQKQQLVDTLRAKKMSGQSAADEGRQLQAIQHEIKSQVATDFAERLQQRSTLSDERREAITARTYPWFFFRFGHGHERGEV